VMKNEKPTITSTDCGTPVRKPTKGSLKKTAGRLTGSRRLRAEGRGDQAKDAVKH
jgi:hypothetical protein